MDRPRRQASHRSQTGGPRFSTGGRRRAAHAAHVSLPWTPVGRLLAATVSVAVTFAVLVLTPAAPARSEDVVDTTASVELATDSTPTEEPTTGEPTPTDTVPTGVTQADTATPQPEPRTADAGATPEPEPTTADTATPEPEPTTADTTSPQPEPAAAETAQQPEPTQTEDPATATEPAATASPTIASDLADYPPGATVTLTGVGWLPDTSVRIVVNDTYGSTWKRDVTATVAPDGTVTDAFSLPAWFVSDYDVTATGSPSGRVATTRFTDLAIGTYDQCSNDTGSGYSSGDTGCRWINGNLQSNNSRYFEGDATVQRLWLTEFVPGSTHTVTLKYGTTKGGKHAYDFLTTWDWSENWITLDDRCQDITGCTTASETTLDIPQDPNVPNSFEPSAPGDRQFVMRGATLNSATTPTIVSGSYAGDSETVITVSFTVGSGSGSMCSAKNGETTCGVALWFGAHVAAQANWGLGLGAGSISGSPYHVALDAIDSASVGQRDNQMQANAVTFVPNGTIVIVKDAIPNDAQDFSFNLNNNSTISQDFSLDDDADATLPNSQTFSVPPGTWTASELNVPTGWALTNLVCVDPSNNTSVNLGTATATIGLASSETVTCTFTNSKQAYGDLTVTKTAIPSFSRDYEWSITKDVDKTQVNIAEGDSATFNYTVTVTPSAPTDSNFTVSGVITLSNPNPVDVTGVTINDAVDNGGTCTIDPLDPGPYTVAASSTRDVEYSCSYESPPTSLAGTNTATATWTAGAPFGTSGSASGSTAFDFASATPTVTDGTVTVQDDKTDPANPVTLGTWNAVDGAHSFTYSLEKSGVPGTCTTYDNTATITETGQGASASVTLCVGSDLTVSKTATGTYDRDYLWNITKSATDPTRVSIAEGGSYTFGYTVGVNQTGFTDSGWQVAGTITVANPNSWQDITADVTDVIDNGGTCAVDGGTEVTVPADMQVLLHYECTYASAPSSYSATNTATATWDAAAFFTPTGSASGQAAVTLTQDGTTNQTITVTDSHAGDLGTVTASDDPDNPATASFTYTRTESGKAGTCTTYDNTATITETGQSADASVELCVGSDLTVTKTAVPALSRLYRWTIDKSVDHTRIDVAGDGTATFTYGVTVAPDGYDDSAWVVTGQITVDNPNDWQAVTVDVSDSLPTGQCTVTGGTQVQVPAGDSVTLDYQCQATSGDTVTNTATATWDNNAAFTPNGTATGTAEVDFSTASVTPTNETITVIDDKTDPDNPVELGTWSWNDGDHTFEYSLDKTGEPGTCVDYTNTAIIKETGQDDTQTVTVCAGADLTMLKTASGTFDRTYLWDISKDADQTQVNIADGGEHTFGYTVDVAQTGITDSGWRVSGTIRVLNPNTWQDVTLTSLSDTIDNGGTCTLEPGPYTVPAGTFIDVDYTCTYATAPTSYTATNTATTTWDAATYLTPTGTTDTTADLTLTQAGATNKTIHVTDTYAGDLGTATATDTTPYTTKSFTYQRTENGEAGTCTTYDNTATITETGQGASASVTLCVGSDLTVSKTATGTYDRDYLWNITKSVTPSSAWVVQGSTPATFNYTVVVNQTGFTDSGWQVAGTITVANPNDWQDITLTGLADEIDNGGTCAVDPGPYVVPRSGSIEVAYACSYATAPTSYASTNTATATWDKDAASTPTGSASGSKAFTLTQDDATNKTVTVTDTFSGATTTLGTVTATDTAPFATKSFTYKRTIAGVPGQCTTHPNVATITETGQSATQSVTVCTSNNTGALTIGYWQNKNGQSIITGGASTNNVCNSGTWLRQFAPFQDLSATARCSAVGTYVTNVIKAANASGASMNAMLKAQMLATALNVYFSDPALGGNKINAPTPIGSLNVDITKICTDLTCTAVQDSSSAFGGSPKTVLAMLTYASSQANVGGKTWYGNAKAMQELAKDAFDALNNRKVLIVP